MTKPIPGSNPASEETAAIGYAGGVVDGDLPSFWTAVLRYRHRHGLSDDKRQAPLIDDDDLRGLRDQRPARDFAFDTDILSNPSSSNNSSD